MMKHNENYDFQVNVNPKRKKRETNGFKLKWLVLGAHPPISKQHFNLFNKTT